MFRNTAILVLGLFSLMNFVQAQSRTCRLVFPERPQSAPKTAYIFDGKASQAVSLPSMNLSEVIELPNGEITIAMTTGKITDPKTLPPKSPLLKIPENIRDFYIIITSDPENKELPIKMNMVNTGEGKLKPGETLWYNLTNHRIAAKLGSAEIIIDPNGRGISKDPLPESGYYTAILRYQADGKGAYAPITEQSWWHDAKSRHLGFMVNTGGKLPRIYYFRDFRAPKEEEPAEGTTPAVVEQTPPPSP
jgi:hypothetical protein